MHTRNAPPARDIDAATELPICLDCNDVTLFAVAVVCGFFVVGAWWEVRSLPTGDPERLRALGRAVPFLIAGVVAAWCGVRRIQRGLAEMERDARQTEPSADEHLWLGLGGK